MLVRATQKGYYGDRIREAGMTFNYTPPTVKKGQKKPELPSWMVAVETSGNVSAEQAKANKLTNLQTQLDDAKKSLSEAEAHAKAADENLQNAKPADKQSCQGAADAANEELDNAVRAVEDAEEVLAAAESE